MTLSELFSLLQSILTRELFKINQTSVSLSSLIFLLLIIGIFAVVSRILRRVMESRLLNRFQIDPGTRYMLVRITQYVVMTLGVIIAFQNIGINLSGLAVIFGLLSVGIGFGLQNVASNFISGLILLFERPIRVGDRVTVGGTEGDIVEINIRSTTVRSLNNISIIVPNSEFISNSVINWSHGDPKVRLEISVGVSYDSDLDTVISALEEVARASSHVLKNPAPEVHLVEFGDSSWNMQLRVWIADPKIYKQVRSDLNCAIVRKFRERRIEIPFPQRDLHVRSSVSLPIAEAGGAAKTR